MKDMLSKITLCQSTLQLSLNSLILAVPQRQLQPRAIFCFIPGAQDQAVSLIQVTAFTSESLPHEPNFLRAKTKLQSCARNFLAQRGCEAELFSILDDSFGRHCLHPSSFLDHDQAVVSAFISQVSNTRLMFTIDSKAADSFPPLVVMSRMRLRVIQLLCGSNCCLNVRTTVVCAISQWRRATKMTVICRHSHVSDCQ